MTKYLFKKTGLFQFTNFLEWSIEKWPISRTGCQFGVPGVTYPPKKYPSAPPPPGYGCNFDNKINSLHSSFNSQILKV